MSLPFPQSKNHLLSVVDKLPYTQRFKYASRLGNAHKDKPALRALVNDLLKHPDPPVPEMEAEEGFTEILPAQRTSISKYYNEDQLALAIAVSAGYFEVIKERLHSPSTFFDNLVVSNYVRMQEDTMRVDKGKKGPIAYRASDKEVSQAILDAVPARRQLLLQECIQAKRFGVISLAIPALEALPNYSARNIGHMIHACPPAKVKEFLTKNKLKDQGQIWPKLIKFHITTIFELMEADLVAARPFERTNTWESYCTWVFATTMPKSYATLAKNKAALGKLLELAEKYPAITFISNSLETTPVVKPGHVETTLPAIIQRSLQILLKTYPERTVRLLTSAVYLRWDNVVTVSQSVFHSQPTGFWNLSTSYEQQNAVIKHILSLSLLNKLPEYGADHDLIAKFRDDSITKPWNTHQTQKVSKILADYLLAHRSDARPTWLRAWKGIFLSLLKRVDSKRKQIDTRSKGELAKTENIKKDIAKYRKAAFDIIATYYGVYQKCLLDELDSHTMENYKLREANTILDAYHSNILQNTSDPHVVTFVLEKVRPSLEVVLADLSTDRARRTAERRFLKYLIDIAENLKQSIPSPAYAKEDEAFAKTGVKEIFQYIRKSLTDTEITTDDVKSLFAIDKDLTFELFFRKEPLNNFFDQYYVEVFDKLSPEQRKKFYQYNDLNSLKHLVKHHPDALITFVKYLPTDVTNEAIVNLLSTAKAVDENTRNSLLSYQDITDNKVRNSLQKLANSNNVSERSGALNSLITATIRSKDLTQSTRTLKFIREKIKNETQENRAEILGYLFVGGKRSEFLLPKGMNESQFSIWFDMIADAIESTDLDTNVFDRTAFSNHPILQHFWELGKGAIEAAYELGGKNIETDCFEFGAEILWKLCVFRHGEKKAAMELYQLPFTYYEFAKKTDDKSDYETMGENELIPAFRKVMAKYFDAYEKRIATKNPNWKSDYRYYSHFFSEATATGFKIPEFVEMVHAQVERIKAEAPKDDDGLYIIADDDSIYSIMSRVETLEVKEWDAAPLVEFVDLIMHSRFAPTLLSKWVSWKEVKANSAREFKDCRDKYIVELLKISPSAIHLRFVWRHLLTYMQDRLDDYIGKRKTFRGVFYVAPEERKFARSCLKTPATRRPGGRARSVKKGVSRRAKKATSAGVIKKSLSDAQREVEEERAKEKKIVEELESKPKDQWDHEDFFYLEACYGLHRLLPRQVNTLAQDWSVQLLNNDRAIPYRVKATARWSIMPTVTYHDIVQFLNDHEAGNGQHAPLSVNVIETLLRGVMRNDEPTSPLNFLLSPKFLGSDRSRVSVYAIAQSVPYMPADGLTNMLKLCLSGKRRQQLKISSYKEIIRLLTSTPTEENLNIIFNEWQRKDLHRDIRIATLHAIMTFLNSKDDKFITIAWKILENAATLHDQHEILTALLGPRQEHETVTAVVSAHLRNQRIMEHLDDLSKGAVPDSQAKRYATNVIAEIAKTAQNDDVKFVAVATLGTWPAVDVAIEYTLKHLKNLSQDTLLYSTIPRERSIFSNQWVCLAGSIVKLTTIEGNKPEILVDVATTLCNRIAALPNEERTQRTTLVSLAETFLNYLPIEGQTNSTIRYPPGVEAKMLLPFQNNLHDIFAAKLLLRRRQTLGYASKMRDTTKEALALIHDLTAYTSRNVTGDVNNFYETEVAQILQDNVKHSYLLMGDLLDLKVDATKSAISSTPEYLYLLRRVALNAVHSHTSYSTAYPQQVLRFWENFYQFSVQRKVTLLEHQKSSKFYSNTTLCTNISTVIDSGRSVVQGAPTYMQGTQTIIQTLAQRYLTYLRGTTPAPNEPLYSLPLPEAQKAIESYVSNAKNNDPFAQVIGEYLLKNNSKFFAECVQIVVLIEIFHLLLKTTNYAQEFIPNIVKALHGSNMHNNANKLVSDLLRLALAPSDKQLGEFYINQARIVGLELLHISPKFTVHKEKVDEVIDFFDEILPILPSLSFEPKDPQTEIKTIVSIVEQISTFNPNKETYVVTTAAASLMNKYITLYLEHPPKKDEREKYTPIQVVRKLVVNFVSKYPLWVTEKHRGVFPKLAHFFILEAEHQNLSQSTVVEDIVDLLVELNGRPKDQFSLVKPVVAIVSDIIHLRLSGETKTKIYIETSFDLAKTLIAEFPSYALFATEDFLYFLNWAISVYINELDAVAFRDALTKIVKSTHILPPLKEIKEDQIQSLVSLIRTLIELKHQNLVLPQQLLLPLQSLPQYSSISRGLALAMVGQFGVYLRCTEEHEYVWRREFEALLDQLSGLRDPEITRVAWNIATKTPK